MSTSYAGFVEPAPQLTQMPSLVMTAQPAQRGGGRSRSAGSLAAGGLPILAWQSFPRFRGKCQASVAIASRSARVRGASHLAARLPLDLTYRSAKVLATRMAALCESFSGAGLGGQVGLARVGHLETS